MATTSCSSKGDRFADLDRGRRRRDHTTEKQTKNQEGRATATLFSPLASAQYSEHWMDGRMAWMDENWELD